MVGVLSGLVDPSDVMTWLLCLFLVGYFVYKEYPEFKKRVSGGVVKESKVKAEADNIMKRLDGIEAKVDEIEAKITNDFRRINQLETETEKQAKRISDSLEERELLMRGMLASLKGLQEQGCNGPVTESITNIEEYLNRQAHK